ncbi:hypothetical protein RJ640_003957 [Escallonia rubra]|uniref:Chitinase domain-containing protein 1 n=1 Tax=Escallonia rubra TaxID=112253 RepID=A0AA88S0M3_9ASTE|nr:hypothetical protein RJ640_003957 [Escallonia rubra]
MANRRDRRAGLGSDRRAGRVHPTRGDHQTTELAHSHATRGRRLAATIFAITFVASSAISAIVYRTIYAPPADPTTQPYVYQRGLVKTDVNYREILTENAKVSESNASDRHYKYPEAKSIDAWLMCGLCANCCRNARGYELAKRFNSKLTHVSPVWYDLKSQGTKLVLEGRHNADTGWISELRMKGDVQLLPRVVLEAVPVDFLKKKKKRDKAINLIIEECKEMGYNGVVLESWSRWAAYGVLHDPDLRNMALQFVKQLGQAMHSVSLEKHGKQSLQLVYVIGPPHSEKFQEHDFGPEDLQSLSDAVDGYSLMTYDFSSPQNPGPNAPLRWIRSTLQLLLDTSNGAAQSLPQQIFVGINFYGNDFVLSGDEFTNEDGEHLEEETLMQDENEFPTSEAKEIEETKADQEFKAFKASENDKLPNGEEPVEKIEESESTDGDDNAQYEEMEDESIDKDVRVHRSQNVNNSGLGGGPIVGREYLSLLEQHRPLFQWEKNSAEHFFLYSDDQNVKHVIFYPSLMSIAARLDEASLWGAGISIWEIGQGLDYFFDIL